MEENKIDYIKEQSKAQKLKFVYFAADWCPTSLHYTPQVLSIFKETELSSNEVNVYMVNRFKSEPKEHIDRHKITNVPTLIILKDETEIGRITEYPKQSWLDNIVEIIEKN